MAGTEEMDEKAKRMRALLSSFYGEDAGSQPPTPVRRDTLQGINMPDFDSDRYIQSLLRRTPLEGLLQKHVEMAAEIKNLDSDMQMLVYENYNKFISATDTIRRMKENVAGIESNMDQLLETVTAVRAKSDGINSSLCERRERIEELNGTRSLLRKIQFIFDLPKRLRAFLKSQEYAKAVKSYMGALPILKAYGNTSFAACREESEQIIDTIAQKLQAQVADNSIALETRAEAVKLLQQLEYPVGRMVESYIATHWPRLMAALQVVEPETPGLVGRLQGWLKFGTKKLEETNEGIDPTSPRASMEVLNKDFIADLTQTAVTYRALFPEEEKRLTEAALKLFNEYFVNVQKSLQPKTGNPSIVELTAALNILSQDTGILSKLVPDAGLPEMTEKAVERAIQQHVVAMFSDLYTRIIGSLVIEEPTLTKEGEEARNQKPLRAALDNAKRVILFDSVELLRDLRDLLEKCGGLLQAWRDSYIDLVQAGFQDLFTKLNDHFIQLSSSSQDQVIASKSQTASQGLVLMLALLSVYIQQTAVPKITEVIGASFVGGGAMGFEARPAFVPSEVCRIFFASGEKFLHEYIDTQARKVSILIRKSVETPNWLKYKEPRDVRMFADLLLQEVSRVQLEVEHVLDQGSNRSHRRTDSAGSGGSSRSNAPSMRDSASMRESGNHRTSFTARARSRLLERDVAKLFKQKVELFTKIEFTQASVMSTIIKMCLKTFQECVRLQTFNRSGYNQIQVDALYLRDNLREKVFDNETVVDSLLDEVCSAAADRCIDPVPLEAAILDRLIEAKKAKGF
ncbi:hypothetical protein R1flu_002380 [Riccia fluitans]|uniref:Vacuolar protein sorting-associated protein 51 homolog n=1 Tax=Riccia fluitans TaxID=41844 RepID=A0ABD1Y6G7_9MARC